MSRLPIAHERIPFGHEGALPEMDLRFAACRTGPDGCFYDVLDFAEQAIDRWTVPHVAVPQAVALLRQHIPERELPLGAKSHEEHFRTHCMTPHTAQIAPDGRLFVSLGDPYNGPCVQVIDRETGVVHLVPDGFANELMAYASTGGFSATGSEWLTARWPLEAGLEIASGDRRSAPCEIVALDTDSLGLRSIYGFEGEDGHHQVACSPDDRYAVLGPFKWGLKVPYPAGRPEEDPAGYRRSHNGGIKPRRLVTVDLESERHWETRIPVPVAGHPHFDPLDPRVLYLSCHNISPTVHGMMIEGPASIYRMRLLDGKTAIEGRYTDRRFLRISQHALFTLDGRTRIAVTNLPNYLELLDAESMTLWRRVEVFPAPPLDLRATGNALCPQYPQSCFSVSVSADGRYVALPSSGDCRIYDVADDRFLDAVVPLHLPEGSRVVGHVRRPGE